MLKCDTEVVHVEDEKPVVHEAVVEKDSYDGMQSHDGMQSYDGIGSHDHIRPVHRPASYEDSHAHEADKTEKRYDHGQRKYDDDNMQYSDYEYDGISILP